MPHESVQVERSEPGVVVLRATGDLDAYTVTGLREHLHRAADATGGAGLIVVDLSGATFIDSAGLGALVGAQRRARERGGRLRIVRPPPLVLRAFELTGLDEVLELCATREEALSL